MSDEEIQCTPSLKNIIFCDKILQTDVKGQNIVMREVLLPDVLYYRSREDLPKLQGLARLIKHVLVCLCEDIENCSHDEG